MASRIETDRQALVQLQTYLNTFGLDAKPVESRMLLGGHEYLRQRLEVQIPQGGGLRTVAVRPDDVRSLLGQPLDGVCFFADYDGLAYRTQGRVEIRIEMAVPRARRLWELPGVDLASDADFDPDIDARRAPKQWALRVEKGDIRIEISPPSPVMSSFVPGSLTGIGTIKFSGLDLSDMSAAKSVVERVAGAFFFDLDMMYGTAASLARRRTRVYRTPHKQVSHVPHFPRNRYAPEALSLYQYGRSSSELPLLEFLAYYQALEYFFPAFAHAEASANIRNMLRSPRFSLDDDADIARLVSLAAPAVRAGAGEREQLRATLAAAVTHDEIYALIQTLPDNGRHFTRKPTIKGVQALDVGSRDLRTQLADRIYAVRCRIVHTKADAGNNGDDLLLPTSSEVQELASEIELLRYVAQRAIVAQAVELD